MRQARADGREFRLVLTDLNMPDVDGLSLSKKLLAATDGVSKPPAIILLTSGDRPRDRERSEALGISHLMKPVCQSELFETIVDSLNLSPAGTDVRQPQEVVEPLHRGLRILLAEDALANQVLAVRVLQRWDHEVTVANHGAEAVALAREGDFDLILMDVQMPELDGFEATREIRAHEHASGCPRVPIVAMTAHALKGDRERCLDSGMDGYVSKPIRIANLQEELNRVLEARPAKTPDEATTGTAAGAIDWTVARESALDDDELLGAVIDAFLQEWPDHRKGLQDALASDDSTATQRFAHLVKGVMVSLGGRQAQEIAGKIEAAAAEGDLAGARRLHPDFEQAMQAVETQLRCFRGNSDGA